MIKEVQPGKLMRYSWFYLRHECESQTPSKTLSFRTPLPVKNLCIQKTSKMLTIHVYAEILNFGSLFNALINLRKLSWLSGRVLDSNRGAAGLNLTGVTVLCP